MTGGYLALAQLEWAQGHSAAAHAALQQAAEVSQRYSGPAYWVGQVELGRAQLWLREGNLRAVADWLSERNLPDDPTPHPIPYLQEDEYLLLVRWRLARARQSGETEAVAGLALAGAILGQILAGARNTRRTVGCGGAGAASPGQPGRAAQRGGSGRVAEALLLAEPEGYLRLFVDEGERWPNCCGRPSPGKLDRGTPPGCWRRWDTRGRSPAGRAADPLSEREVEILRLISAGMSNKELAGKLVLTVGTVKWHLNNIYSKLGVRSRTQAIAKARELGLI